MDVLDILNRCDELELTVDIERAAWRTKKWLVRISSERDDVALKVEKSDNDAESAIRAAWAQFNATAQNGMPALMKPVVDV